MEKSEKKELWKLDEQIGKTKFKILTKLQLVQKVCKTGTITFEQITILNSMQMSTKNPLLTMKYYFLLLAIGLFISCNGKKTSDDSNSKEKTEQQTDQERRTSSANGIINNAPNLNNVESDEALYAWVDKLNIRNQKGTKAKVIGNVSSKDKLVYAGEKSDKNDVIVLRGKAYDEPWLKVKTPDGKEGWVFGGAVKRKDEEKGNDLITDKKFSFPYFGTYDLSEWKKMDSTDESGGDAEIGTTSYQKGYRVLEVSDVEVGDYGYQRNQTLKDMDGKILRKRSFSWSADVDFNEAREEVIDFNSNPAKKYTRTQKFDRHFSRLNAKPVMVNGVWKEENYTSVEAPKSVTIGDFDFSACNALKNDDSGCSCSFRGKKDDWKSSIFTSTMEDMMQGCITLNGKNEELVGKRTDRRAEIRKRGYDKHWIELNERGGFYIFGKKIDVNDYEDNRDMLVQTLLLMDEMPNSIPIKKNGTVGMGTTGEFRSMGQEAIDIAKKLKKEGNKGVPMKMYFSNAIYDVEIEGNVDGKTDSGGDTYAGTIKVRAKDGRLLGSRQFWGSCQC